MTGNSRRTRPDQTVSDRRWWVAYLQAAIAAALLMLPAALNRAPLYYEDTELYLSRPAAVIHDLSGGLVSSHWVTADKLQKWTTMARPADSATPPEATKHWLAGRSLYWGLVAYAFVLLIGGWGVVAMNAALTGVVLSLLWHRTSRSLPLLLFPVTMIVLAFTTPLSAFVAFVTPDLLSGLLILSLALLSVSWRQLHTVDRVVLSAIGIFSAVSHDSHLAIAALMIPPALLIGWRVHDMTRAQRIRWSAVLAAPLFVGLLASALFSYVARQSTGGPPERLPHLTAQFVNLPAGQRYIRNNCRADQFAICSYADRLPTHWIAFIFDTSPQTGVYGIAPPETRKRLSSEQYRFALAVTRQYPWEVTKGLAGQGFRQIGTFQLGELDQQSKARYFKTKFPSSVRDEIQASAVWRSPELLESLDHTSLATALLGSALLGGLLLLHLGNRLVLPDAAVLIAVLMLVGLLINAVVCGVLASPLGRFQARIMWMIPFTSLWLLTLAAQPVSVRFGGRKYVARF